MLMNSLWHLLIPADSRDEVQQTLTENRGKKSTSELTKLWKKWLKEKIQHKSAREFPFLQHHPITYQLQEDEGSKALERLGILYPSLPKLKLLLESHQVWWSLHTPRSPCQRIFFPGKENLPSGIAGGKSWKKALCSQVVSIRKDLMMARGSQGTGFVPTAKYRRRERVIPHPAFPTFSSQPNTQQSWLWLSQLLQTAFWNNFSLQEFGHLFRHFQQRVEVAFNSHGLNYLNI